MVVKKYFRIHDGILLPEDEIQRTQYSREEVEELDSQINELKNRFFSVSTLSHFYLKTMYI